MPYGVKHYKTTPFRIQEYKQFLIQKRVVIFLRYVQYVNKRLYINLGSLTDS